MLFSWQFFIGLSVISYSLVVLLQRVILRNVKRPVAYAIFSQLLCAGLLLIFGLLTGQLQAFNWSSVWLNVLIMAGLYGVGNIFVFSGLQVGEASKFTVLFATRGLITVLGAVMFLHESISWIQVGGAALIFLGVVSASWQNQRLVLQKGDYLALAAAICFGLANANDRFIVQNMPVYTYVMVSFLLPPLVIAILKPQELRYIPEFIQLPLLGKSIILNILYALSTIGFFWSFGCSQ